MGVKFDERYDVYNQWCKHVRLCIPRTNIYIVIQKPSEIHWENRFLHNPTGPSVCWPDGMKVWSIEGHRVDEQLVLRPQTQTLEQIDSEDNADLKAIRIDRYGWARYLTDSKAECIDTQHDDIANQKEALYRYGADGADGDKRLVVSCPTGRVFIMGVPRDGVTCIEAQQFLAGDKPFNVLART